MPESRDWYKPVLEAMQEYAEAYHEEKMRDLEFTLNDILNKALITQRIKNINSNTIAEFVNEYLKQENDNNKPTY